MNISLRTLAVLTLCLCGLLHAEDKIPGLSALVAQDTPLKAGTKIAIFGDSITMQGGYIATMKKALSDSPATKDLKVQILPHGLNGGRVPTVLEGKSPWGDFGETEPAPLVPQAVPVEPKKATMQSLLDKEKPNVVVVFLGVNDVWHGPKGTAPEDFKAGLKKMAEMIKAANAKAVFATLACIGEKPDGSNEHDKKLDEYAQLTRDAAKDSGAALADVRKTFMEYLKAHNTKDDKGQFKPNKILTYDGVHMQPAGNDLLADCISQAIVQALKEAK